MSAATPRTISNAPDLRQLLVAVGALISPSPAPGRGDHQPADLVRHDLGSGRGSRLGRP